MGEAADSPSPRETAPFSEAGQPARIPPRSRQTWQKVQTVVALLWLVIVIAVAILAPLIAPYEPNAINLRKAMLPPSWLHPFGTDRLGRDVLSRTMHGLQISMFIAFCAVLVSGTIGSILGLIAGYFRGWIDVLITRLADLQFALPAVVLSLALVGALGPGVLNLVVALSLYKWARFARIIRAETLSLREREFVLLARLSGASHFRVVFRHLLPNALNTFLVLLTLDFGVIIILEATLSFLGLGVQPPNPALGSLIADGRGQIGGAWWITLTPGLVLMLIVLAISLLGDRLRDRLSPTLSNRW